MRAPRRRGRGDAGVALSPHQDGGADDRRPAGYGRLGRCHLPADHARPADVPRSVGGQEHGLAPYSHSMVAGGLLVTSSTTRLTSGTSLVIRVEIRASTSSGSRAQSAVIASSLVTGRSTTGWP